MKKYLIIGAIILTVFLLILGSILLAGNTGKKNSGRKEQVELTWWKPFQDRNDVQPLLEAYEKGHPNVKINFVKKNIATYENDLIDAIASGNAPDIFSIHNDWVPKHIEKIAPMTQGLLTERQYRDQFVDVASSDFIKDGKIYAIPLSTDVLALYYNKDILGSAGIFTPPTTWREVEAAAEKVTRQDSTGGFIRSGIAMGTAANVNRGVDILLLLMLQNGTQFYNENMTGARFAEETRYEGERFNPGATALAYYTQFARPNSMAYNWSNRADNSVDAFAQGKLAMMISYSYMLPTIKDKAPNLNWGVAGVPQVDSTGLRVNFANYWGESVAKSSAKQVHAWDFLNFISQKDVLAKYYEKVKAPSSRKDILPSQTSDVELGVFAENAATAKSVYKPDASQFESIFVQMMDDVITRGKDPEDAVKAGVSKVNLLLRQ